MRRKGRNAGIGRPTALAGIRTLSSSSDRLLPESWQNDVKTLMAAKAYFYELFADAKSGKRPRRKSKPNKMFAQAFPEKGSLSIRPGGFRLLARALA